jgi:hypothetical protein
MKVKKARAGIGFYLGAFTLLVAIVIVLLPSIYGRTRYGVASLLLDYPAKLLDLSESSPVRPLQIASRLIPAALEGRLPADIEELRLDIKFKHLQEIKKNRSEAIELGILRNPDVVPGRIEYDFRSYRAKVRLKGRLADHWMGPDRWSLRVRLRGGETIKGFNQFSLQRPRVRQLPFDQLFQYWVRQVGNLTPDFEFFRLYVNGDYWGIALAEEHMSKYFLEANRRKESALIKLGSVDSWYYEKVNRMAPHRPEAYYGVPDVGLYGEKNYRDEPRVRSLFSYAQSKYLGMLQGEFPISKLIDVPAFTKTFLIAVAWNHNHTLADSNARYYLNPYTLLLEPVTTDQTVYSPINSADPFWNPPFLENGSHLPILYQRLVQDEGFHQALPSALDAIKRALPSLQQEYSRLCVPFPLDCAPYDEEVLRKNIEWVEGPGGKVLGQLEGLLAEAHQARMGDVDLVEPTLPVPGINYPEHIYATYREGGILRIYNLLSHIVELRDIRVGCKIDDSSITQADSPCRAGSLLESPVSLGVGKIGQLPYFEDFDIGSGHINASRYLIVTTALGEELRENVVRFSLTKNLLNPLIDLPVVGEEGPLPRFLRAEGREFYIAPGDWKITQPLIFPEGHRLTLSPGTVLRFAPNAYLLVRGPLRALGEEERPILLTADERSWKGLYVLAAKEISELRNVTFSNTSFFEDGVLQLTGGVTFYRSDVDMEKVKFENSIAEDSLNVVESKFDIRDTVFEGARSDAFDADYAQGVISDSIFREIGGDGLDTSGSEVSGARLIFEEIFDKAVSAGEASEMRLNGVRAQDVGAAVVSKDGSDLSVSNLSVSGTKVAVGMAYKKKSHYGPARLTISFSDVDPESLYNQIGNQLVVDGRAVEGVDLDVDALYREGPMKKVGRPEASIQ